MTKPQKINLQEMQRGCPRSNDMDSETEKTNQALSIQDFFL